MAFTQISEIVSKVITDRLTHLSCSFACNEEM